jgi:hypothetical protein
MSTMNKSPFDAKQTRLIDPRFTKDYTVFLYKSDMPGPKNIFNIQIRSDQGTMGIHANTRAAYMAGYNYICSIYGLPHDEDDDCVMWEMADPEMDDSWVDNEVYHTENATYWEQVE